MDTIIILPILQVEETDAVSLSKFPTVTSETSDRHGSKCLQAQVFSHYAFLPQ